MDRLREELNPEERFGALGGATLYPTDRNRHALHCRDCGGVFYVDDSVYHHVARAIESDPTANPFCCDRCEEEYAEENVER
jgi:Fe2+ or Zn2+ uptake regulation protein